MSKRLDGQPCAPATTLLELIETTARERPTRTALIDEHGSCTYAELYESGTRLAGSMARAGLGHGSRVGLWLPNSVFWLQTHLALAHLGAIAIGINARYPAEETARIMRAAGIHTLVIDPGSNGIADAESLAALTRLDGVELETVICRDGTVAVPAGVASLDGAELVRAGLPVAGGARPETPCSVFTSSGSTGVPKLILHSQGAISSHSRAIADDFAYTEESTVVLGQLPLCGVWGFNTAYAALAAGATTVLMERFDATRAVELTERHRVTHANGPDLFLRKLFAAAEPDPKRIASLRAIGFSTFSNDSRELVDLADGFGVSLFQVYGSSEQQALMVHRPLGADAEERADPGGRPSNPGTRMRIRDTDTGELVGPDVAGLLESTGPNVMLGYLTRDGIDTSALTDDGWVRTGDIGMLTSTGMRYLSRATDVLRLSGFLVDPQEIEVRMEEFDGVVEAKVVGVDTPRGTRCVAFVRPADGTRFDEPRLIDACRSALASFKVPLRVFPVDDFPRVDGANGPRIQRKALRAMAQERLSA